MSGSRRESLTRLAWNPATNRSDLEVLVSAKRIGHVLRGRNKAEAYTAARILTDALRSPHAVFEGLRRDEDEPRGDNSVGWLCYAYHPVLRYDDNGRTYPTQKDRILLAFINDERVVYNWTWDNIDKSALDQSKYLPENYKTRFDRRIF